MKTILRYLVLHVSITLSLFATAPVMTTTMTLLEMAEISASDAAIDDSFGTSVAINDNGTIVVGSSGDDDSGSAYVYVYNSTLAIYEQVAKLTASDAAAGVYFGTNVAISGDTVVVGISYFSGTAYVFEKPALGWSTMNESAKLTASDSPHLFGQSVAISGDTVIVGAHEDDSGGTNSGSAYLFEKPDLAWSDMNESAKFTASDAMGGEYFGKSVAISGNTVIVGASNDDDGGTNSGSAYIFEKPDLGWSTITESAKLTASDAEVDDHFGKSVAISGNTVIVGASNDDDGGTNSGSAYIFEKPDLGWSSITESAKLTASDAAESDFFGVSVAISGDTVIVGAHRNNSGGTNSGSAYIFEKPDLGWSTITESTKLTASDAEGYNYFGKSVAISSDTVIVGAYYADGGGASQSGSAYIFRDTIFNNTLENKNLAIDIEAYDANGDTITYSIIAGEDSLLFDIDSATGELSFKTTPDFENPHDTNLDNIYKLIVQVNDVFSDSSWNPLVLHVSDLQYEGSSLKTDNLKVIQKTQASNTLEGDFFASSVALSGDFLLVGAREHNYAGSQSGIAYLFEYNATSQDYIEVAQFTPSDAVSGDLFGISVAMSGDTVVIGATGDDDNGSESGSAYIFEKPPLGWAGMHQSAKLTASNGALEDFFGISVAISGDTVIVGAYKNDSASGKSGSAYLFEKPLSGWANIHENARLTASDAAIDDYFAYSVAISGDTVVVGAYKDDDNGSNSGSAYLFEKPLFGWRTMTQSAKLSASDGAANDHFSRSVAISGDTIIVGAYQDDDANTNSGSAYLFEKPLTGWTNKHENAKFTASDSVESAYFARSVAISGDTVAIGAYKDTNNSSATGSAYLFEKPLLGWSTMTQSAKLYASDGAIDDFFGYSVAVSGDTVLVGAYQDDDNALDSGSMYIYKNRKAKGVSPSLIMYLLN